MTEFVFRSPFQPYIQEVIRQKQSLGYKYDSSARSLYKFDQFCLANGCTGSTLSKDLVYAWSQKRPNEAHATLSNRIVVVRQLAMYMNRVGIPAYVLPKNTVSKGPRYIPHIFSNDELAQLFKQTDACHYRPEVPNRQWIMPLLFRMLYGCGLRISEALQLKLRNVDLDTGVLTIMDGKFNKNRLVPLSAELHQRCHAYVKQVHTFSDADAYFFPGSNGQALTQNNAYKNFRKFLWRARISHGGWGKGPRLHDFRHTFAVHCLRRWVQEGKDLTAYLPVLKTYLGHHSFSDTSQYLRLTAELYPDITAKVEHAFGHVIPVLEGDGHEAN
ncbi:tyrosine-type recombinase/integrase [Paenibacillus sp. BR2-3]|uniref:tyrosine-type recombinase/integrase n=1 Tax=Paenibacillus sp. BR2-3 TaxID=3048494 RepID=UPI003977B966